MIVNTDTVLQLNTINTRFYGTISQEFSDSRRYYWHGWREFLPQLEQVIKATTTLKVLDIGCGNGRFAEFLSDTFSDLQISYTGIDNSAALLKIAETKLPTENFKGQLIKLDIVKELLSDNFLKDQGSEFDLIVAFGVVHHLPSYKLRKSFFKAIGKSLSKQGLAVLTLWRFMDIARLEDKTLEFNPGEIDLDQLEKNDHLIHWYRGKRTFRYCHYTDKVEEKRLIDASGLELESTFEADGKEGKGNTYLVLKKTKKV